MTLPTVSDSLAGRVETLRLLPLSQSELHGVVSNWLDAIFAGGIPRSHSLLIGDELTAAVLRGGFPEVVSRESTRRRKAWARQYIDSIIERDVQDVAEIHKADELRTLLHAFAHASGQITNYRDLGAQVGLDHKSTARYTGVLEKLFLLNRVKPYLRNRLKRIVKAPKIHFIDSALLATLADFGEPLENGERDRFGSLLETFVYAELLKHSSFADGTYAILFYRDYDQLEVDFVIENTQGHVVAVEVKSKATVKESDLRGRKRFAHLAGDRFKMGILLYDGRDTVSLGSGLYAAPISSLWGEA
jgi:predicted AAA+ superfamily ATPase